MKSYTNIEQSKKLAEFLPLESADMYYEPSAGFCTEPSEAKIGDIEYAHPSSIRCWSLAALLSVLDFPSLTQNKEDEWEVCVPNHQSDEYIEVSADNPVDACYEMILKLHELKTL